VEVRFRTKKLKKLSEVPKKRIYSDLPIPPGEYLAEVIAVKGISQAELARRLGRPVQAVNEIIKGGKAITPETALQLERALDVPAHIWTGLESRYQLIKARREEKKQLQKESRYLKEIPYKDLASLHFVKKTPDYEHKVRELHRFYGVSSLANLPWIRAYEEVFKSRGKQRNVSYALAAWLRSAELRAREIPVRKFDKGKLRESLKHLRALSAKDPHEFLPQLEGFLARLGVVLVTLHCFQKTCAQGATFWIRPDKAVLLMGEQARWTERSWLNLFHGIGHILLHGKRTFIDAGKVPPEWAQYEKEADDFARDLLARVGL